MKIQKEKKNQKKIDREEEEFLNRFRGVEAPILILDERWLRIFPEEYKTSEIKRLERELREAFKYQARLTSDMEDAEQKKKQLMDRIIRFMNVAQVSESEAKKQEKSQEYIKDINEQLSGMEMEYENMPDRIKELNEELLVESLRVCYRRMKENKDQLAVQKQLVLEARALLQERRETQKELRKENERIFSFMHRVFGSRIIEIFDEFEEIDEIEEDE